MFNARTRGLRERAKTMEDIAHHMVGKLEGARGVKSILATYPCHQPAESLAFRTSLAKYLEALRQQCVYAKGDAVQEPAAWWKEVVVRRSLLEECAGDKFERLMLSLSTHVLMRASRSLDPTMMSELLRTEPLAYTVSLKRYQAIRNAWSKTASLLLRVQTDSRALRSRLVAEAQTIKYDAIPTSRLKSSVDAVLQELLKQRWTGDNGQHALKFVVELAGLRLSSSLPTSRPLGSIDHGTGASSSTPVIPSPLPIAAAHHPAHLKRMRRSVLQRKVNQASDSDVTPVPLRAHSEIVIADHLDSEKRMYRTLVDALAKLQRRCSEAKEKANSPVDTQVHTLTDEPPFWTINIEHTTAFNFTPQVNGAFMASLGLEDDYAMLNMHEDFLEKKIEVIRGDVLLHYPPVPDLSTPRLPPRDLQVATTNETRFLERKKSTLPAVPTISPGKSARSEHRKSVLFSMTNRQRSRPSMFRVFSGQLNDEVDRLIDETHDFPTDGEDTEDDCSPFMTPKGKGRPKVNRIWTAGTPASAMRSAAKANMSTPDMPLLLDGIPAPRLPSISLSMSSASSDSGGRSDEDMLGKDVDATPRPLRHGMQGHSSTEVAQEEDQEDIFRQGQHVGEDEGEADADPDVFYDDPPSLTLKEILLSADTSHFDLLEMVNDDMEGGVLTADASFVWE